jgi:type II secretory pathway pseudopilin PulG
MGTGVAMTKNQAGFSLMETLFAIGILTVGALGMAGVFSQGMKGTTSSPNELVATQKAAEAIESVFSARDSKNLSWAQIRNQAQGGIFKNGPQPMHLAGVDGILNTNDDDMEPIESIVFPGQDQQLGTADDVIKTLSDMTREILITDLTVDLRSITVTITYKVNGATRTYALTALISDFA